MDNVVRVGRITQLTKNDITAAVVSSTLPNIVTRNVIDNKTVKADILSKVVNSRASTGGGTLDTSRFKFFQIPTPSPDGAQLIFTLSEGYVAGTLTVYRDQLALQGTVDFAETTPGSGVLTLTSAPDSDEVIWCNYISVS